MINDVLIERVAYKFQKWSYKFILITYELFAYLKFL